MHFIPPQSGGGQPQSWEDQACTAAERVPGAGGQRDVCAAPRLQHAGQAG